MMILCDFAIRGNFESLSRAQAWALERLIFLNCASGDLRWAVIALALRSFTAAWVSAQGLFRG
jgi:hypothetical protein